MRRQRRVTLSSSTLVLFCLVSTSLVAQDTLDLGDLKYREVGPSRGGRVTTVAGVTQQPNVFYMGATGGGVWKTEDFGHHWKNISDGFFGSPSIGALAVWQKNPAVIYAGTGSDGLRSNVISGDGIYRSLDAGKTWTHIGLPESGHIGAVLVDPADSNTVYVAAIGQAFSPNAERGIFKTVDGGASWTKALFISDRTGFSDLEMHPTNSQILYAGAWRAERKPWTIISGDEQENGIYRTTDGGQSWEKVGEGLPSFCGKIDLAVSAEDPDRVVALIEAPGDEGGLYQSDDAGQTWEQISSDDMLLVRPFYFLNVDLDPTDANIVYVNSLRLHKSTNGGKEWKTIGTPHGDNHAMWINPTNPLIFIQGNDGGANVTLNGGKSWSHQFNQPTAELYQVEADNAVPYRLYAGQQDNYSAIAVPNLPPRSMQAGHIAYIEDVGGCETGPAVPSTIDPNIVYANCKGRFSVFNRATGQEQKYDVGVAFMYGHNPTDLKYRFQRVSPIHVSPHDGNIIYHTSQYVHKTMDGGKTWHIISPDLTAFEADKQVRSGGPITEDITGEEFYSTIYAIRESTVQAGLIWVGANDGPVHMTRDGGQTWQDVTPQGLPKGGRVDAVEPSPHDPAKAYISVLRYQLGDWKPYIYKTTDYGSSWTLLTGPEAGIPTGFPTRVVRESPTKEGVLFAGTEYGLFASFNDGDSWVSAQGNLPVTPISDLKFHQDDLIMSTMGRGFWILDDVASLWQNMVQNRITGLLPGRKTIMLSHGSGRNRQLSDYPRYPRPGVYIDYFLAEDTSVPVTLDIFDAAGTLIRSFKSVEVQKDSSEEFVPDMATGFVARAPSGSLKTSAGLHRFRWDMCHAGTWSAEPEFRFSGSGPLVEPGKYSIVLTIGDHASETIYTLDIDPRLLASGVTSEALKTQVDFALSLRNFLSEVYQQVAALENERDQLKSKRRLNRRQKARLANLEGWLSDLVTEKGPYPKRQFVDQVEYLYGHIAYSYQLPGQEAFQRLEELKSEWENMNF